MTDVVLVRWPEETERLERLRAAGAPRLLLVGEDLAAPEPVDPLEDWIRLPAAEDDAAADLEDGAVVARMEEDRGVGRGVYGAGRAGRHRGPEVSRPGDLLNLR